MTYLTKFKIGDESYNSFKAISEVYDASVPTLKTWLKKGIIETHTIIDGFVKLKDETSTRFYYIHEDGTVISQSKSDGICRVLTTSISNSGYVQVGINPRTRTVHTLMAEAFLPSYDKTTHEIDHINFDPTDNSLTNLQIITIDENRSKKRNK